MTWSTMDILAKARRLETTIARKLDQAAKDLVRSRSHDPLEIAHVVVEQVEEQIEPSGRGTRVFPFTRIALSVVAPNEDARARFEAVFEAEPSLAHRIAERLKAAGCTSPLPSVSVDYVGRAHKNWRQPNFDIKFSRVRQEPIAVPVRSKTHQLELTIVRGTAERKAYSLAEPRIDIGRCREVRDNRHRLIRANDIAFAESGDPVNESVSRQHAHITCDESGDAFRVHDDGSAHGTAVVRGGRTLTVPLGARGVRLQSGDEIVMGDARIRVRLV